MADRHRAPRRAEPVAPAARHQVIDVLRGFALFGVLVVNVQLDFSGYAFSADAWTGPTDEFVATATTGLFRMKFVTLFTILFGLGFFLQSDRARSRGVSFLPVYLRRVSVLLLIGAGHALLYSGGVTEVLHKYALMGVFLPLFRARSDRLVLLAAVVLILLPYGVNAVDAMIGPNQAVEAIAPPSEASASTNDVESGPEEASTWPPRPPDGLYETGGLADIVGYHARNTVDQLSAPVGYLWMLPLLGLFLLGTLIGRRRVFENVSMHAHMLRRGAAWGLGLGLVLTFGSLILDGIAVPWIWILSGTGFTVGAVLLAGSYAGAVALMFQRPTFRRVLEPLAAVGRTALTNYLLQTVVCAAVFWGLGLGLYGRVGPLGCLAISVVIFVGQTAASVFWVRRFRFGPVEWIWRGLTYMRRPAMTRAA